MKTSKFLERNKIQPKQKNKKKPRVLLTSASVGAGHTRAAQAIQTAFDEQPVEIEHFDILDFTSRPFVKLYKDAYFEMVNRAPQLYGWLYDSLDRPFKKNPAKQLFEMTELRKFRREVAKFEPDVIISTHFLPSTVLSRDKKKKKFPDCPLVTVITDIDVHGLWLEEPSDHYFVADGEAEEFLRQLGIEQERITFSGIPTHPDFHTTYERSKVAKQHGLDSKITTILFSAGGFGLGKNIPSVVRAIVDRDIPLQLVVVCGKNESLLKEISKIPVRGKTIIKPIGFTTKMHELMACSDLLMGKPGGLTTSESFNQGLGWIVLNPIPGQEENNADFLLQNGAAIRCKKLSTLPFCIETLLSDKKRLASLRASSAQLAKPKARMVIAKKAMSLAGLPFRL